MDIGSVEIRKVWAIPVAALGGVYKQEQWLGIHTIVSVERIRHLWNKTTHSCAVLPKFFTSGCSA